MFLGILEGKLTQRPSIIVLSHSLDQKNEGDNIIIMPVKHQHCIYFARI